MDFYHAYSCLWPFEHPYKEMGDFLLEGRSQYLLSHNFFPQKKRQVTGSTKKMLDSDSDAESKTRTSENMKLVFSLSSPFLLLPYSRIQGQVSNMERTCTQMMFMLGGSGSGSGSVFFTWSDTVPGSLVSSLVLQFLQQLWEFTYNHLINTFLLSSWSICFLQLETLTKTCRNRLWLLSC